MAVDEVRMEYTGEERREFWKVGGARMLARCQIILITEGSERELATDSFTADTTDQSNFIKIVHTLIVNDVIDKYLAMVTTDSTIEYRVCVNNFPHAMQQDQITDAMTELSYVFKLAKIRLTLLFANSSHMMVKRLSDWVRELRMSNFSVLIAPLLVTRIIPPPSDVTAEMKRDRVVEECRVLRKLWAGLLCVSRLMTSEKVLCLCNYNGNDYFPSSVSGVFQETMLDKFTLIINMSMSILSDSFSLGNLTHKLVVGFLPFCLFFKLQRKKFETFSASLMLETSLAKYVEENTAFQSLIQTIDELCAELKKTKLLVRRVKLIIRIVSQNSKSAQERVMSVAEEIDRKPETVKGVKGILKGVENLVKLQSIPKEISMETHKNAEYGLHKVNQSCIELDYIIREFNFNIGKYSKYGFKLGNLMDILARINHNCEGSDLLLILEKLDYFGILSRSYGVCVQMSRYELESKEPPLAGRDLKDITRMLKIISNEIKWVEFQLELLKQENYKLEQKQELIEMLRKNKTLQKSYEKEIEDLKGLTAKGELENLIEFSLRLKSDIGKDSTTTDTNSINEAKTDLIIPPSKIYIKVRTYLDLVLNAREDSPKILTEFATKLQQIETKLSQLSSLLYLDDIT